MTDLGLSATQLAHAKGIVAAVRARKWAEKAAVIAMETAITESGLRMYANGNNPESMQLPHESVGWDHGSVGLFQQQVGGAMNSTANWGTTAELMDAEVSTSKFLNSLSHQDWQHMNNWNAAQAVQGSAFPDGSNYRANDAWAGRIVAALWTTEDEMAGLDDHVTEAWREKYCPTIKPAPTYKNLIEMIFATTRADLAVDRTDLARDTADAAVDLAIKKKLGA